MKLFSYWRSQATFRVRIALRLKKLAADVTTLDLLKGDQYDSAYRTLNPGNVVPTLIDGDGPPLVQSLAILEYLDEKYPDPPLMPKDIRDRAHVRAMAQMMAMDVHPLVVPRVRKYLEEELHLDEPTRSKWLQHWSALGSQAIEQILSRDPRTGKYCFGDTLTIADVCLVPHLTAAKMLGDKDLAAYPTARRIYDTCMQLDAFALEVPLKQPDAPKQPA
ncbi:MAG: maleylacetoacetate isomerase [Xanthobacteraceae bacterium]